MDNLKKGIAHVSGPLTEPNLSFLHDFSTRTLHEAQILEGSKEKQRKFLETVAAACLNCFRRSKTTRGGQVELQIGLKDYDTQRDKRFAGIFEAFQSCFPLKAMN